MSDVKIFNSPMFGELRTSQRNDGELLFCLKDVCDSLGLQVGAVVLRLQSCHISSINVSKEVISHGKGTGKFKEEGMYFVTEPDLYRVIFQSRKSTARKFQDWVFNEVLPALRKDGAYVVANQQDDDEALMAKALLAAERAIKRHEERLHQLETQTQAQNVMIEQKDAQIEVQQKELITAAPKVKYYDDTLASVDFVTTQQIANEIGMNTNALNKKLEEKGVLYYQSKQWLLKMPYKQWNLHGTRTFPFTHSDGTQGSRTYTVWNQRGRRFILALHNNDFNVKKAIEEINEAKKECETTEN